MSRNGNYELLTYKSNSYQNQSIIPNNNLSQKSLTCWNCSFFFKCNNSQPVTLCPNCNKYNRVPQGPRIPINNFNIINNNNDNNNDNIDNIDNINAINSSNKVLICPYCYTKNLFESDADELICYKCSRKIKSDNKYETHEILTERESLDKNIIGWKLVPNPQYIEYPRTPISQSSNTDYLLKKILKSIKKQNMKESTPTPSPALYSPFVPFPFFDYFSNRRSFGYSDRYDEERSMRTREIRYVPIKTESTQEKNEGYKITIRKKNRKKNGLAKSTVFEKVFYINK